MHHPVRQCEPDTAALTEAGHHPTGAPVITKSPHRPDQRVSIRGKSERPVDNLFDSSMFKRRKVPEADLERRRNPVKVFLQKFVAEIPGSLPRTPGHSSFFIGTHEHAFALLAQIKLAVRINNMQDFLAGRLVDFLNLRHIFGNEVHVLHGEHGKFQPHHTTDFPGPESGGIDDMFRFYRTLLGNHQPAALGRWLQVSDPVAQIHLGALHSRRLGECMRDVGWRQVTVHGRVKGAQKFVGVDEWENLFSLGGGEKFRINTEQFLL